jgi:hypothetical protein
MQQRKRGIRIRPKAKKVVLVSRKRTVLAARKVRPTGRATRSTAGTRSGGLDKWGQDHLALLSDPCGAPLVPGVYPGVGGSQFLRTRTNVNPGTSVVDAALYFCPSGAAANGNTFFYASVNNTGATPTTSYGGQVGVLGSSEYVRYRCLAACVKLRYAGTVLNRGGNVSRTIVEDCPYLGGTPTGYSITTPSIPQLTSSWPTVNNMADSTSFEVRWLPGQADTMWIENQNSVEVPGAPGPNYSIPFGNAVGLAFNNVFVGSCYFEITAVWEVVPASSGATALGNGLVATVQAPRSVNTVNDILRAIGNITKWATTPEMMSRIRNVGSQIVKYAPAVMSAMA